MTLENMVNSFPTTPILFIGSGISRRYLGLPDWKGLLAEFVKRISNDEFAYNAYVHKAESSGYKMGLLPKVAGLIQKDFDDKWFTDSSMRIKNEWVKSQVLQGVSPFKAEVAYYIESHSEEVQEMKDEILLFENISKKSITSIITTNYDSFLEEHCDGFKKYIGQRELIFSAVQGIAEIYKIHGSIDEPGSIIINDMDYRKFEENAKYLAAKLMTLFVEYPIIFMGYSLNDENIINIINTIIDCLDEKQIDMLEERFVFVEYRKGMKGVEVLPYTMMIKNQPLRMKQIVLDDFSILYKALKNKQSKLPAKILRRFKEEIYEYTLTAVPTGHLRIAEIGDERVKDEELILTIAKASDVGLHGLVGMTGDDWYRNIITDDLDFTADEIIQYAFAKQLKQNSNILPVYKYLSEAKEKQVECEEYIKGKTFDSFLNATIIMNRKYLDKYHSVKEIWENENSDIKKAIRLMTYLKEQQIDVNELEKILSEMFEKDSMILAHVDPVTKSNIRKLILFYDYLKWGKTKEPLD